MGPKGPGSPTASANADGDVGVDTFFFQNPAAGAGVVVPGAAVLLALVQDRAQHQHAQPTTLAPHLLAHADAASRDLSATGGCLRAGKSEPTGRGGLCLHRL